MLACELTQPSSVLLGLILSEAGSHVAQASLVFPTLLRLPSISGLTSISQGYRNVNSLTLPSFYRVLCMYFFFNSRFSLSLNSVFEGFISWEAKGLWPALPFLALTFRSLSEMLF